MKYRICLPWNGFFCDLRVLVRKLASSFGHPTQVSTQVQFASTCDYLPVRLARALKRESQLAHMRIIYHFIANLHITETLSVLFLTKYDKDNIIEWAKAHSKTGFSVNGWKWSKTLRRLKRNSTCRCTLISGWRELFSNQLRKLVSKSARSQSWLCTFNKKSVSLPFSGDFNFNVH